LAIALATTSSAALPEPLVPALGAVATGAAPRLDPVGAPPDAEPLLVGALAAVARLAEALPFPVKFDEHPGTGRTT
jgi:hypothetical protein